MRMEEKRLPPTKSMKYLVGFDIADHIKEEIKYFFDTHILNKFSNTVKLIYPGEYHITLAYLGLITEGQRERLISVADRVEFEPFSLNIKGISFYPPGKSPKALWVGINQGREILQSFSRIVRQEITQKCGLMPKDEFFPHINVAKLKNFSNEMSSLYKTIENIWDYPFGSFMVKSFHLYRVNDNGYTYNHEILLKKKIKTFPSS